MENYRAMILAEMERRGVYVGNSATAQAAVTRMVRVLEDEMTEFGTAGVAAFVLGLLTGKGWQIERPV